MKNTKQLSSVASAAAVLALLVCVSTSLAVWRSPVEGASQDTSKRMLRREHPGQGEPVLITRVTVAGKDVRFNNEFDAGDDWYKSLAITVENHSQKPISYVEISIRCPRPEGSDKLMLVNDMTYGADETRVARPNDTPIAPGESTELKFTGDEQTAFEGYLRDEEYANLSLIEIAIHTVIWSDGTKWHGGRIWPKGASGNWSVTKPAPRPSISRRRAPR